MYAPICHKTRGAQSRVFLSATRSASVSPNQCFGAGHGLVDSTDLPHGRWKHWICNHDPVWPGRAFRYGLSIAIGSIARLGVKNCGQLGANWSFFFSQVAMPKKIWKIKGLWVFEFEVKSSCKSTLNEINQSQPRFGPWNLPKASWHSSLNPWIKMGTACALAAASFPSPGLLWKHRLLPSGWIEGNSWRPWPKQAYSQNKLVAWRKWMNGRRPLAFPNFWIHFSSFFQGPKNLPSNFCPVLLQPLLGQAAVRLLRDGGGSVEFSRFVAALVPSCRDLLSAKLLRSSFDRLDENGDGFVSRAELQRLLERAGSKLAQAQCLGAEKCWEDSQKIFKMLELLSKTRTVLKFWKLETQWTFPGHRLVNVFFKFSNGPEATAGGERQATAKGEHRAPCRLAVTTSCSSWTPSDFGIA